MATNVLESVRKAGFGKTLAVTAAFSLPVAALVGIGWVAYRGGLAARKRLSRLGQAEADIMSRLEAEMATTQRRRERADRRTERELEEAAARLEKAHREFEVR